MNEIIKAEESENLFFPVHSAVILADSILSKLLPPFWHRGVVSGKESERRWCLSAQKRIALLAGRERNTIASAARRQITKQ